MSKSCFSRAHRWKAAGTALLTAVAAVTVAVTAAAAPVAAHTINASDFQQVDLAHMPALGGEGEVGPGPVRRCVRQVLL